MNLAEQIAQALEDSQFQEQRALNAVRRFDHGLLDGDRRVLAEVRAARESWRLRQLDLRTELTEFAEEVFEGVPREPLPKIVEEERKSILEQEIAALAHCDLLNGQEDAA